MHATAKGQLGLTWARISEGDADLTGTLERDGCPDMIPASSMGQQSNLSGSAVQIYALSATKSNEATAVIQEQRLLNHPLGGAYTWFAKFKGSSTVSSAAMQSISAAKRAHEQSHIITKTLLGLMPVLSWLPRATWTTIRADLVAGLTVGVMAIPQSMSYASIAGLPYIFGMYSACVPAIMYSLFGQSRQLAVGPVAMVSLLVESGLRGQLTEEQCPEWYALGNAELEQYEVCPEAYANLAILTAAVMGSMQILAGFLRLGFLVSFLGHPVISGFTSGAAIIIGLSQVKYILGFNVAKSEFVHVTIGNILSKIDHIQPMTLFLGSFSIALLFGNRLLSQKVTKLSKLGPLGPLIVCALSTLLIWLCIPLRDEYHVKFVGDIPSGIFPLSMSSWDISSFSRVLPTAVSAMFLGYMESIAIGKSLASKHGYDIEAGHEFFALGLANLAGSMFSCYPVTGSFSRSAVNNASGATSQLAGLITAVVMLCTLLFLCPLFRFLPQFALAAIVINSVVPLIAVSEARKLWRTKGQDFVLWVVAFAGTLFLGVLIGIGIAVVLSIIIVIYESARPQITVLWRIPGTTIYRNTKQETSGVFVPNVFIARIGSSLYFANASFVKEKLLAYIEGLEDINRTEYVVLEMTPVISVDSTAVHVIHDIVTDLRARGVHIAFAMVGNRVEKTLRRAKLWDHIGADWFLPTVNEAVHQCLRHQRAKQSDCGSNINTTACPALEESNFATIYLGDEIGISNDLHHSHSTVFVSLAKDIPMAVSEIADIFRRDGIAILQAQVVPRGDGGSKHTYFVRKLFNSVARAGSSSMETPNDKLSDAEIRALRQELEMFVRWHREPLAESDARELWQQHMRREYGRRQRRCASDSMIRDGGGEDMLSQNIEAVV
jgi:sulfate transporter 4